MKTPLLTILFIFIALASHAQLSAEQEVRSLEHKWLQAYEQNDTLAMHQLVAETFAIRYPNGHSETKKELMALVRRHAGKPSSHRFYTEGTTATVYPATIILRGIVVSEVEQGGKRQQHRQYYTDTWVKTDTGWQVVASHLSDVPSPAPGPQQPKG
ncbi:nuclear transport factor 2 family protein [Cesiribacter andamanensis]|uniref:DUF4440 domain-containing protein n=1 Tax=Cesiribacter andamanensis AMV16 TaxID=1279009 RepID=M7NXG9_9BACT|nr:nuclear transport factor 2 family protein [Cesiribacter andamanensis]EMR03114.1 hypothetical protein ADICEAN_01774 [Cesiribacter andamanensis AMV16]